MSVEEICKGVTLLRDSRENDHAVDKTHHNPIDSMFRGGGAGVPAKERQAWGADQEAKADEIEAEFRLVHALVASSGKFGGAVGQKSHNDEAHESADRGEGIEVAKF